MGSSAKEGTQPKPRLIVRLGRFLASHHILFSVLCCSAGIIALLFLPALAKNTYLSENALIPGSANPLFSTEDVMEANKFIKGIEAVAGKSRGGMVCAVLSRAAHLRPQGPCMMTRGEESEPGFHHVKALLQTIPAYFHTWLSPVGSSLGFQLIFQISVKHYAWQ